MKREKVGSVYSTYDYNAFRRMIGNRDVKKTKVNEIISSIEKHGQLMVPVIRKLRVYMETDYKKGLYLDEEDK